MSQVLAELGTTAVPPGTPQAEALLKISSFLVCAFDVKQLKPDAEGIRAVMSRAGVLPEHWLHVGDEDADEAAAKGAGCHFVRVSPASGLHWQDVSQFVD
jgi:phosphoglycolate phosphatase-like HAD superfamily hydrolase